MSFLKELKAANEEAKRERARRVALSNGNAVKAADAREEEEAPAPESWEGVAVIPHRRFSALVSPVGLAVAVLGLLLVAFPQGWLPVRPNAFIIDALEVIIRFIIVVTGLNIIAGYTGQLSLGQGIFTSLGAYTSAIVTTKFAGNVLGSPWMGFVLAVLVGGVVGAVLGIPSLRVKGAFLAVVTLAFIPIFQTIYSFNKFSGLFGGTEGIKDVATPIGGRLKLLWYNPTDVDWFYLHVVMVGLLIFFARNIVKSRVGRGLMAIRESEIAAKSCGVNVTRYKTTAFVLSSIYASIAGVLYVHSVGFVSPSFPASILESFKYVVMLIVGGTGTLFGPVLGATAIELTTRIFSKAVEWQQSILGSIAIITVAGAPLGIVGMLRKYGDKILARFTTAAAEPPARTDEVMQMPRVRPEANAGDIVLEAKGMSKVFGGLRANDAVDITVRKGTVHSLIGPNGSGKTTFINTVTGVYTADEGLIEFLGERCDDRPLYENVSRGMGRTFQNLQLWRRISVLENVMVGLHTRMSSGLLEAMIRTPRQRREEALVRERARGLLEFVGIGQYADVPAGQLPYGPQRLLEIARALALDPVFLILDEPAAGLNPSESGKLTQLIRKIASTGITVFLIEHHMDIVMNVSDEITVFDFGQKIAEGTPKEVQTNPRVLEAYLGEPEKEEESEKELEVAGARKGSRASRK